MKIDFQRLTIPDTIKLLVREVIDGVPVGNLPGGWNCITIFHPATKQYYSTKSINPLHYEEIVRLRLEPRWTRIAVALRKMLDHHPEYQFFIMPHQARPHVEGWLSSSGMRRIATCMGEGESNDLLVLFKVYSPYNKMTRYVTAASSAPKEKIIKQANSGFAAWLGSGTRMNRHERETMRVAARSKFLTNTKVFEDSSIVARTNLLIGRTPNQYRALCTEMNIRAVREFILSTARG